MENNCNKDEYKFYNMVKKNSFDVLNINLSFEDGESIPMAKIGSTVQKRGLIAGGETMPNIFAPFNCEIKDIKKIRIAPENVVSTHIQLERNFKENIVLCENDDKIIETRKDFLSYVENKGVIDCQSNCDLYQELYKKIDKANSLVINFYDTDEYTKTYKYMFKNYMKEYKIIIEYLDKLFNFKEIIIIYDLLQREIMEEYRSINKIRFIEIENNIQYNTKLKIELKSVKINTKSLIKQKKLYFDAKTLYDIYLATIKRQPITTTIFTIGGDAIENVGIYKMPIGVSMKEIIEIAKTKNTYEYVDMYFFNAMEAHNDQLEFEKEINEEQDENEKQKLIELRDRKKREADEKIFSKMEDTRKYYNQCLGVIYQVQGNKQNGIYSQQNVVTSSTSGLIMVTRDTLKKL